MMITRRGDVPSGLADRTWKLTVRQSEADGRCIVYGTHTSQYQGESGSRGGEIVGNIGEVPDAVYRVAEYLNFERRLADECIAALPAEEA
jgi:hypothetical protein